MVGDNIHELVVQRALEEEVVPAGRARGEGPLSGGVTVGALDGNGWAYPDSAPEVSFRYIDPRLGRRHIQIAEAENKYILWKILWQSHVKSL